MRGQNITIHPETAADHDVIRHVNQEAFDLTLSRCTSGNERITRKTEVADDFPIQVVCDWIGNTEPVASKYYLQVTEDHFAKAVQNPVQQPAVLPRTGSQATLPAQEKTPVLRGSAAECDVVPVALVPPKGFEQSENSPRRVQVSGTGVAKSGAVDGDLRPERL